MQNAFLKLVKLKHIFTAIASSTANSLISIISLGVDIDDNMLGVDIAKCFGLNVSPTLCVPSELSSGRTGLPFVSWKSHT